MASNDVDGLRDDQWERLQDLVPGGRGECQKPGAKVLACPELTILADV